MITEADLSKATGEPAEVSFQVESLDLAGHDAGRPTLAFLDDARFLEEAVANPSLAALLVSPILENAARSRLRPSITIVVVDDPRWHFYSLHNKLASRDRSDSQPSQIADSAVIHSGAVVDAVGVSIGRDVVIEPNATILKSSRIGEGAIIRAGAVIGTIGFEHKRTSRGILSVAHDGEARVGAGAEIGSLTVVARGFARRHTVVGPESRLDCNVMIAHGTQLGSRVFVAAGATLAGSTQIGDDVWIGPGATLIDRVNVGEGAHIGIGSVVYRDVQSFSHVLGNPARVTGSSR